MYKMYGEEFYIAYFDNYSKYFDAIKNSTSLDEVYAFYDKLNYLFEEANSKFEENGDGGYDDSPCVDQIDISSRDWRILEGASFDDFLNELLNTAYFIVFYTDGSASGEGSYEVTLNPSESEGDGIEYKEYNGSLSEGGNYTYVTITPAA
ncbi:MAG: hypothetical protein IJY69_03955 [Clostridia bacterium]|nr:hypothetical protein [Clostridia bacterium]